MNKTYGMYRAEDKFSCTEKQLLLLQSRLKTVMSPDTYSRNSSYRVTSLYFDDYADSRLSASEDGVSYKNKYRIRMYNGASDAIKLEVKYKAYNRVYKKSETISREMAETLIAGSCVSEDRSSMESPVTLFNLAIKQDLLRPKIIVEYDRNAYVFSPGNVRITFDRNIRASNDISGFLNDTYACTMLHEMNRILEIKYDEFLPGFIAQLLESGNMNQTSYSKYKLCREQMGV